MRYIGSYANFAFQPMNKKRWLRVLDRWDNVAAQTDVNASQALDRQLISDWMREEARMNDGRNLNFLIQRDGKRRRTVGLAKTIDNPQDNAFKVELLMGNPKPGFRGGAVPALKSHIASNARLPNTRKVEIQPITDEVGQRYKEVLGTRYLPGRTLYMKTYVGALRKPEFAASQRLAEFKKLAIPRPTPYSPDEWARRTSSAFIGGLKGRERRVWRKAAMRSEIDRRADDLMRQRNNEPQTIHRLPLQRAEQRNSMVVPSEWRHTVPGNTKARSIPGRFDQLPRSTRDIGDGVTGAGRRNRVENLRLNPTWERKVDKAYSQRINEGLRDLTGDELNQQIGRSRRPGGSTLTTPTGKATPKQKQTLRRVMQGLDPSERQQLIQLNQNRAAWHRRMKMTQRETPGSRYENLYARTGHDSTHVYPAQKRGNTPRYPALNTDLDSEIAALATEKLLDRQPVQAVREFVQTDPSEPVRWVDNLDQSIRQSGANRGRAWRAHNYQMRLAAERQGIANPWQNRRAARFSSGATAANFGFKEMTKARWERVARQRLKMGVPSDSFERIGETDILSGFLRGHRDYPWEGLRFITKEGVSATGKPTRTVTTVRMIHPVRYRKYKGRRPANALRPYPEGRRPIF